MSQDLAATYEQRAASTWRARCKRLLSPPDPFLPNKYEPSDFPLGRYNLYVGGGGRRVEGYVNIDLFRVPGHPEAAMREMKRVLASAGHLHIVTPFCHPFHEYPSDYRRYTIDGLKLLAGPDFEAVAEGWRTGPTATLLVMVIEYFKLLLPFRWWRMLSHGILGWLLFPLRYLDLLLLRSPQAHRIGNHCYVWFRKI